MTRRRQGLGHEPTPGAELEVDHRGVSETHVERRPVGAPRASQERAQLAQRRRVHHRAREEVAAGAVEIHARWEHSVHAEGDELGGREKGEAERVARGGRRVVERRIRSFGRRGGRGSGRCLSRRRALRCRALRCRALRCCRVRHTLRRHAPVDVIPGACEPHRGVFVVCEHPVGENVRALADVGVFGEVRELVAKRHEIHRRGALPAAARQAVDLLADVREGGAARVPQTLERGGARFRAHVRPKRGRERRIRASPVGDARRSGTADQRAEGVVGRGVGLVEGEGEGRCSRGGGGEGDEEEDEEEKHGLASG